MMNAHKFVAGNGIEKAKRVLNESPSNAQSYQDGYYFRITPEFLFHNGHQHWNMTTNNGQYFKDRGFDPISISELKQVVESVEIIDRWKGLKNCKDIIGEATSTQLPPEKSFAARMIKAIADYELVESYKSSNGQTINHYFVSDFKENETLDHLSIKQNSQVEILDMVDVSPNCEVRNG